MTLFTTFIFGMHNLSNKQHKKCRVCVTPNYLIRRFSVIIILIPGNLIVLHLYKTNIGNPVF